MNYYDEIYISIYTESVIKKKRKIHINDNT
jgi:hypothetical protein